MNNLLYKELRLALHPTTPLFILLSSMLLIPNYPYYVVFFYTSLGLFFICLTGRENRDISFTAVLPVRKRDIVASRMTLAVIVELLQMLVAVPFAIMRNGFSAQIGPNASGMDANIALFGLSFVMIGIFNYVFFTKYYKNPDKVGRAFVAASIAEGVYAVIVEVMAHAVPFFRDVLDTPDPDNLAPKLIVLAAGALIYAIFTYCAWRESKESFEKLDL